MNVLGIALTPGHLIIGAVLVVLYDALWTWVFNNDTSDWWFERLQGFLKLGIYAGFLCLAALVSTTPWPWNLVIALSAVISVMCIIVWLRRRRNP
ncbi:hypothetical protein HY339_03160 [Candidatus Gottesmanbacteria bacterium]|nr:hypothetical protein [Candidatus Gottesmanbacteria bacterium]